MEKVKKEGFWGFWLKKVKKGQKGGFWGFPGRLKKGLKRGLFRGG